MSILIRGLEIPFTCLACDFHRCAGGVGDFCSLTKKRQFRFKNRPKDCPLEEIVQCNDCRHWLESRVKNYGQCDCDALMRDAEFFCSYGERKDDEVD